METRWKKGADGGLDTLKDELESWRTRLDELRVQAHLGHLEFKDKLADFGERLEPAMTQAEERLSGLAKGGATEVRNLARSLQSGWGEVRRSHAELAEEARRKAREEG